MTQKGVLALLNLAILIVAFVLVIVCVKRFYPSPPPVTVIPVGTRIPIPGVDYSQTRGTLLLILQDGCRYCEESAGFYRRLLTNPSASLQWVAVLPHEPSQSRSFLDSLGVNIKDIKRSSLREINVPGTPTLVLLDSDGTVKASWVGKLSPDMENEVMVKVANFGLN